MRKVKLQTVGGHIHISQPALVLTPLSCFFLLFIFAAYLAASASGFIENESEPARGRAPWEIGFD